MAADRFYNYVLGLALFLLLTSLQVAFSIRAHLSVNFIQYSNLGDIVNDGSDCDGPFAGPCDPFFTFTIYDRSSRVINSVRTQKWSDSKVITFGRSLGGSLSNPVITDLPYWNQTGYRLIIKAEDEDVQFNDIIANWDYSVQSLGQERITLTNRGSIRLVLDINGYCSTYFYGPECNTYCKPEAAYSCNISTGEKICNSGNRDSCNGNGECIQGSCQCYDGYSGQVCEVQGLSSVSLPSLATDSVKEIVTTDTNNCDGNEGGCQLKANCSDNAMLTGELATLLCLQEFKLAKECEGLAQTPLSEASDRVCFALNSFSCSEQRLETYLLMQPSTNKLCYWSSNSLICQETNVTSPQLSTDMGSVFCLPNKNKNTSEVPEDIGKKYWFIWLLIGGLVVVAIVGGLTYYVKVKRDLEGNTPTNEKKTAVCALPRALPRPPSGCRRGSSDYTMPNPDDEYSSSRCGTLENDYGYFGVNPSFSMKKDMEPGHYMSFYAKENRTTDCNGISNNNHSADVKSDPYLIPAKLAYISNPVTGYLSHGVVEA